MSKQDSHHTIGTAAKAIGVCADTLRRWELKKWLVPGRSEGGYRIYTGAQLEQGKKIKTKKDGVK